MPGGDKTGSQACVTFVPMKPKVKQFLSCLIVSFTLTLDIRINHLFTGPSGKQYVLLSLDRRLGITKHTVSLAPSK